MRKRSRVEGDRERKSEKEGNKSQLHGCINEQNELWQPVRAEMFRHGVRVEGMRHNNLGWNYELLGAEA